MKAKQKEQRPNDRDTEWCKKEWKTEVLYIDVGNMDIYNEIVELEFSSREDVYKRQTLYCLIFPLLLVCGPLLAAHISHVRTHSSTSWRR